MIKSIDIEEMLFIPLRKAALKAKKYRHEYGSHSDITIFENGRADAYRDICENLDLLAEYNEWAYKHRNEVNEDAQT